MQKLFIIITFLALSASSSLSLDLDISIQEPLGMGQIYSAAKFENKVAVVGSRDIEGSIVKIYDGSTWSEIPIYYEINGLLDSLKLNNFSKVDFDSKGNIWVSGVNYFYKFDGIKWSEYYYDDQYTSYRKNMNFLIDKNDMAWIATSVDNKQGIQKSHLLKYDGKQFEIVFQTNSPVTFYPKNSPNNEMAEMEDGTILCNIKIYRNMDPDLFQGDTTKTLYFFRPDGSIEKKLVPEKYYLKGANPNVKHIFIDSNRIWLSKMTQLFSNFGNPFYCCGGLSLLEDDNWTEFDTTNGLGYSNGVIESVFFTVRTKENKYLIHNDDFMIMDDNNHFHKVSLESVFANSKMIPSSSYNSSIEQTLLNLNYRQKDSTVMIIPLNTFYYNNELWIVTSYGIIVLNSDLITGVENTSFENQIVVFPNPAQDILNISSELQGKDFEIIDVLGQVVQSGKAESTQINLEKMSSGTYLLNFPNSNIKTISFIIIK